MPEEMERGAARACASGQFRAWGLDGACQASIVDNFFQVKRNRAGFDHGFALSTPRPFSE